MFLGGFMPHKSPRKFGGSLNVLHNLLVIWLKMNLNLSLRTDFLYLLVLGWENYPLAL